MLSSILFDHSKDKRLFRPDIVFPVDAYLEGDSNKIVIDENTIQFGRQSKNYEKAQLLTIPEFFFNICPFQDRTEERDIVDAWIISIRGNIPEHSDIVKGFSHFRWNYTLNDSIGYNIGRHTLIVPQYSSVLFKSDETHSVFIAPRDSPVNILSFGLASSTKTKIEDFFK